jgi:hypothetical protein
MWMKLVEVPKEMDRTLPCPSMWDDFVFEEDLGMVLLMLKYILLLYPKIGTPKSYVKCG